VTVVVAVVGVAAAFGLRPVRHCRLFSMWLGVAHSIFRPKHFRRRICRRCPASAAAAWRRRMLWRIFDRRIVVASLTGVCS